MTAKEVRTNPSLRLHHIGSRRGYVSRKSDGVVQPYSGRFGEGYVVISPRWDTTQYVNVEYYLK